MTLIELPETHRDDALRVRHRLAARYDAMAELTTDHQRAIARDLAARIGTVDWQIEGYRSAESQRDLSIKFHWGHDHRFEADFEVSGKMGDRHLALLAEYFTAFGLPEDHFAGRDVLDVGCWTGGTTLSLKMLGAARVQALEEVRKYADATNILCRDIYGFDDVQCAPQSLYAFDEGTFDSVYFPGVVYHLSDPVLGLRRLFNRLRDGGDIFVETLAIPSRAVVCRFDSNRANRGGSAADLNRSGWNWFTPSAACLGAWMECAGFEDVQVYFDGTSRAFGYGKRRRFHEITRAGLSAPDVP